MITANQAEGVHSHGKTSRAALDDVSGIVGHGRSPSPSLELRTKSRWNANPGWATERRRLLLLCLLGVLWLASAQFTQAQPTGADQAYDQAIAAARADLAKHDYNAALKDIETALGARPDDAVAKGLQAQALDGKYREEAAHQKALNQARQALQARNYQRAVDLLGMIVTGWPDDTTAKELLEQAKQGAASMSATASARSALDAGDNEKAIALAQETLRQRPGDREAIDILTRAQMRLDAAKGRPGAQAPPTAAAATQTPPVPPPSVTTTTNAPEITEPEASDSKTRRHIRKHEVALSGDFFLGQGNVTMPIGFALVTKPVFSSITPSVAKPDRSSDYVGGTLSYGYRQKYYVDLAYAHGDSSGDTTIDFGPLSHLPSHFQIKDDWIQVYFRYKLPLKSPDWSAYLRVGGSFVKADLTDATVIPALGLYNQTDQTHDYLGNLGGGVGYTPPFLASERFSVELRIEAEGFVGTRSQDSVETLPIAVLKNPATASINNMLYGGIGRGTIRAEYRFPNWWHVFMEGGLQGKFTEIKYSSQHNFGGGNFNELLWGPYIKLGARYIF